MSDNKTNGQTSDEKSLFKNQKIMRTVIGCRSCSSNCVCSYDILAKHDT